MHQAVLHLCGVKEIPSFEESATTKGWTKKLGEACGGQNIERCKRFFNVNEEGLEAVACYKCEVEERD